MPLTSAVSLDMQESYQPKQTIITEISGNILSPIEKEDISLKRKNVQVPIEYDIKRLENKYYLYLIAPQNENNYTLYINDIETTANGIPTTLDFQQNFTVSGEIIPYTIKPGFLTSENDYELSITLNKDLEELISISFPEEHSETLSPGENTITISTENTDLGLHIINVGIYTIPILITQTSPSNNSNSETQDSYEVIFLPTNIETTILMGESPRYPLTIYNSGNIISSNLILEYNTEVFIITPSTIPQLLPEEEFYFNLSLKNQDQPINEIIILKSNNIYQEFPVIIDYTQNPDEVVLPDIPDPSETPFCSSLGGKICTSNQECNGDTATSRDSNLCCLADCVTQSSDDEGGNSSIIGYTIAAIVLIIIVIIIARYYKTRKPKTKPLIKKKI